MANLINIKEEILNNIAPEECPHCNNTYIIKYGKKKSNQRYKCKNVKCRKTFSDNTNKLWCNSKKDLNTWSKCIDLVFDRATIEQCSEILKISIPTAHSFRIKILHAINMSQATKLIGNIEIKKRVIKENFKGNRHAQKLIKNRSNIFIAAAKDSNNYLSKPISRHYLCKKRFEKEFFHHFGNPATFTVFGDRILNSLLGSSFKSLSKFKKSIEKSGGIYTPDLKIDTGITKFSSNIGIWLKKFYGVATKYLKIYLSLYNCSYSFNFNNNTINFKSIFSKNVYLTIGTYNNWNLTLY